MTFTLKFILVLHCYQNFSMFYLCLIMARTLTCFCVTIEPHNLKIMAPTRRHSGGSCAHWGVWAAVGCPCKKHCIASGIDCWRPLFLQTTTIKSAEANLFSANLHDIWAAYHSKMRTPNYCN